MNTCSLYIYLSRISNVLEIIPCLEVSEVNKKVGIEGMCEIYLETLLDIGSLDNPTDRSIQQEVGIGVPARITQSSPPIKHLQAPGRNF